MDGEGDGEEDDWGGGGEGEVEVFVGDGEFKLTDVVEVPTVVWVCGEDTDDSDGDEDRATGEWRWSWESDCLGSDFGVSKTCTTGLDTDIRTTEARLLVVSAEDEWVVLLEEEVDDLLTDGKADVRCRIGEFEGRWITGDAEARVFGVLVEMDVLLLFGSRVVIDRLAAVGALGKGGTWYVAEDDLLDTRADLLATGRTCVLIRSRPCRCCCFVAGKGDTLDANTNKPLLSEQVK